MKINLDRSSLDINEVCLYKDLYIEMNPKFAIHAWRMKKYSRTPK